MKKIYFLFLIATSISQAQPLVGQPTGPSTSPAPEVNNWSMLDYWNVLNYVSVVNPYPGNATMPVLFWGDQGLVSAGASLSTYLADYTPKTTTVNAKPLSSSITLNTSDISEGTNLYYTASRFNTAFATKNTDNLAEGISNVYYTTGRFNTSFATKTSDNLTEGSTNLYFTNARARSAFSNGTGIGISSGVITNTAPDQTVTISGATGTYPNFTIPTPSGTVLGNPTAVASGARTVNTGYQVSATKDAEITVSCSATAQIAVLGSVTATVFLDFSPDNSTWTNVGQIVKTYSNLIGLTAGNGASITKRLKAGWYWRWRTTSSISGLTNTATFTFDGGSEALYN